MLRNTLKKSIKRNQRKKPNSDMKKIESLIDIAKYIQKKHKSFINEKGIGVECCKFIKTKKGRKIFEMSRGFRIFGIDASDDLNQIYIEQLAVGYMPDRRINRMSSILTLSNLSLINVYDDMTEFYSKDGIDFVYVHNCSGQIIDYEIVYKFLHEWINKERGTIRARWYSKNKTLDKVVEELGLNNDYNHEESLARNRLLT